MTVSVLGALVAAALALGVGVVLGPADSAGAAQTPEFSLAFVGLEPGVPMSESATFVLDRDATLVSFEWIERAGLFINPAVTIDIEVCDSAGTCVDPTVDVGVPFAAGISTVSVTVEMLEQIGNGATGAIAGRLTFVADDELPPIAGLLPITGLGAMPWLAAGAAAIGVGALLMVLLGRRRKA
jgi:hypothetical protein